MRLENPFVRRLLLFGVPLTVAALGLIHPGSLTNSVPDGDTLFQQLRDQADLFIVVHLVQLVVFSLLALVVWCLIDGLHGPAATVSRVALLVFVVFYTAFDSVAGIAVGVLVQKGHELPASDQDGASSLIEAYQDSWITGELNVLALVGTMAWLIALVAAAWALRRAGGGTLAVGCMILSGVVFSIGHPAPFGPIGMGFLLIAIWRLEADRRSKTTGPTSGDPRQSRGAVGG
jgi:hypothetical protein